MEEGRILLPSTCANDKKNTVDFLSSCSRISVCGFGEHKEVTTGKTIELLNSEWSSNDDLLWNYLSRKRYKFKDDYRKKLIKSARSRTLERYKFKNEESHRKAIEKFTKKYTNLEHVPSTDKQ